MQFYKENLQTLISISLKHFIQGPTDFKSTLAHVIGWYLINDKPLYEPILTQICKAIWCHKATMS